MRISGVPHGRAAREALLDDPAHDGTALGALLLAARAPGSAPEVAGLPAALASYRSAPTAAVQPEPAAVPVAGGSRFRATKLIAAAASAATIGGVAFAAVTTGNTFSPSTGHSPAGSSAASSADDGTRGNGKSNGAGDTASDSSNGTPTPSLVGLCKAWEAHQDNRGGNGKSEDSAAFRVLISTAGGLGSVNGFCTTLLTTPSASAGSSGHPTHPAHPTDTGGRPSDVTLPPAAGHSTSHSPAPHSSGTP